MSSTVFALPPRRAERHLAGLSPANVGVFLLGATCWVDISFIGHLYAGEVLLAVCAWQWPRAWGRIGQRERHLLRWFVSLAALYFVGLAVSDVYRQTAFGDLARGWSRAVVFATDVVGFLTVGVLYPRRIRSWLFGMFFSLAILALASNGWDPRLAGWKLGLAEPLCFAAVLLASPARRQWQYGVLAAVAATNLLLDYRSLAAFAATSIVLLAGRRTSEQRKVPLAIITTAAALIVTTAFYLVYTSNVAIQYEDTALLDRRSQSTAERLAAIVVTAKAIEASPIIGYGSWAKSERLYTEWAYEQADLGSQLLPSTAIDYTGEELGFTVPVHSQILQGWFEAGLTGLLFFCFLLVASVRRLKLVLSADVAGEMQMAVTFWTLWNVWAILFSPFGGMQRLFLAVGFVVLVLASSDWHMVGRART